MDARRAGRAIPWMTASFVFLNFYSAMAVYRSNGDWGDYAFVVLSCVSLSILFFCLRLLERAPPGSATRGKLKVAAWVFTTVLIVVFSPIPAELLVWGMVVATVLGGLFYDFLLYWKRKVCIIKYQLPCCPRSCLL